MERNSKPVSGELCELCQFMISEGDCTPLTRSLQEWFDVLMAEREVGTSAVGLGRRLDLGLAVSRPTWTGSLPSELAIMLTGPTSILITKRLQKREDGYGVQYNHLRAK